MDILTKTINQMLVIFILMAIGYVLRKKNIVDERAHANLSRMELFIFSPALTLSGQIEKCTPEALKKSGVIVLSSTIIILVVIIISGPISKLFVKDYKESREKDYTRNVYRYAIALANYGFVGNFLIKEIWGMDMFFKYSMFTLGLSIACYAWGLYILIPKDRNQSVLKNLRKGLLSPPIIALVAGILIGLLGLNKYIPPFANTVITNAGNCMGPIAMLLAGMVIGNYNIGELFKNVKVYILAALRLLVIPSLIIIALKLFGIESIDKDIIILAMIAYAAPIGLNTIVFPAAYGGETKTGASMAIISSTFAVVTIPLIYYLFVVCF